MAENNAVASQNGVPEARIVQSIWPDDFRGFLYCKNKVDPPTQYWAVYNDGVTEEINPPTGLPRPEPDLAERTKRFKLPPSLISGNVDNPPSRFTGLMRQVVQCEYNRGQETKYSCTWQKTHGLMELPYPRVVGGTKEQENFNRSSRKYWLIEVSQQGIYAAPVKMGGICRTCLPVSDYQPSAAQLEAHPEWSQYVTSLSLEWAYYNRNESRAVQQLKTAADMNPIYSLYGSPWQSRIGWAFNLQGNRAVNVVAKREDRTWKTRLLTLSFNLEYGGYPATIVRTSPTVAQVTFPGHGFPNGKVVVISGANQSAYNGSFVIKNVAANTFEYDVSGVPATPATGTIKVADADSPYTLTVGINIGTQGKAAFLRNASQANSILWYANSPSFYNAPIPWVYTVEAPQGDNEGIQAYRGTEEGPVYAFYDRNELVLVKWKCAITGVGFNRQMPPWELRTAPFTTGSTQVKDCLAVGGTTTSYTIQYSASYKPTDNKSDTLSVGFFTDQFSGVMEQASEGHSTSFSGGGPSGTEITYTSPGGGNAYSYCDNEWGTDIGYYEQQTNGAASGGSTTYSFNRIVTSSLILPWHDRECAIFLTAAEETTVTTSSNSQGIFVDGIQRFQTSGTVDVSSDYKRYNLEGYQVTSGPTFSSSSNTVRTGNLTIVAGNDLSISKGIVFNGSLAELYVRDFFVWTTNKTAESDLLFMRGGMVYNDPTLTPVNQLLNYVEKLGTDNPIALSGFGSLAGKKPICFVGKV